MNSDFTPYLQPTEIIDYLHPVVRQFVDDNLAGAQSEKDQAIKLYYAVRDGIRYDPYSIDLSVDGLRASRTLKSGRGWCVPKAALLAACCRAVEIPARLGYADVKNHLSTERMRAHMKTDIFFWHGYTSIYLDGKWVKATPAFNIELCQRFRLRPLDFDGEEDSIYHPFDLEGNKHMEYVAQRGEFADVPMDAIAADMLKNYNLPIPTDRFDFDQDVDKEVSANNPDEGSLK